MNLIVEILLEKKRYEGFSAGVFDHIDTNSVRNLAPANKLTFALTSAE